MRYVKIDPEIVGAQQINQLIEVGEEITEPSYIDVTDRPEVTASAWYDVQIGDFVDAPPPPPPEALTADQITRRRRAAYAAESDPLKNEADYDALMAGTDPDYTAWMAAVAAIKERYPLPE